MGWSMIATGRYQRPIGEHEVFLKMTGDSGHSIGREQWAINCTASFIPVGTLADNEVAFSALLANAWKHFRFLHPSIATYVSDEQIFAYDVPDTAALDRWSTQTFKVETDLALEDVIATTKPTPYATMTYFPLTKTVLFHTAHWRTDGIGTMMLMNSFLGLVALQHAPPASMLRWGQEPTRLPPPVEEAANMPIYPSEANKELSRQCLNTFQLFANNLGIPYKGDAVTIAGGTRSATIRLSENETSAVVQQCKSRGFTVTAAVHAAVAATNYAHAAKEDREKHYTSTIRFNLRPHLPSPFSGAACAGALYTSGWGKMVSSTSSWEERARDYHREYRKGITPEYLAAHREYAIGIVDMIRQTPPGSEPPSDVDISSVGIVEAFIDREKGTAAHGIHVESISLAVEALTRQCACFVWTFRDRLSLHVIYNENYHDEAQMTSVVNGIHSALRDGLGISSTE